ncbi:hypothetical protein DPMN_135206 [Dreissena polymorpha]|uniref:HAT C-terminal dimerisation domain-containing protein n=1 Tax=Dreissena polymorpha TaxID=45954 RepID=A0A9D4G1D7_DREPO|nr:hypothetical protein DPMN_135206 [Dreissena polymorpha]
MAVQPAKPTTAVPSGLERARDEMSQYLKSDLLSLELDPIIWWREHESSVPLNVGCTCTQVFVCSCYKCSC